MKLTIVFAEDYNDDAIYAVIDENGNTVPYDVAGCEEGYYTCERCGKVVRDNGESDTDENDEYLCPECAGAVDSPIGESVGDDGMIAVYPLSQGFGCLDPSNAIDMNDPRFKQWEQDCKDKYNATHKRKIK